MSKARPQGPRRDRTRLGERGLARFEVVGRDGDRELIRSLARKLAEDTPQASELRATVGRSVLGAPPPQVGGILTALRRSPLVDSCLDFTRTFEDGRSLEL